VLEKLDDLSMKTSSDQPTRKQPVVVFGNSLWQPAAQIKDGTRKGKVVGHQVLHVVTELGDAENVVGDGEGTFGAGLTELAVAIALANQARMPAELAILLNL
jgi:hypothetical protein